MTRVIFFAPLALLILSLGARATRGAAQSYTTPQHAMGTAPCIWATDPAQHVIEHFRRANNSLDAPAIVRALHAYGFNCFVQVIEGGPPNSFEDLQRLLAAAQPAEISVWPSLIPPSEGGDSLPYKTDYVAWMKEIAKLSLRYPVLRGVNIDDLSIDISAKTFTRSYVCSLYQAKQAINPKLLFVPTIYELDQRAADQLAGCVDGVWFWWTNLEGNLGLRTLLEDSRLAVANRFPLYVGVYAHWTTWHRQGAPSPQVLRDALEIGCRYADGAIIYQPPLLPNSSANSLLGVARAFAPGGSSALAGKCGLGSTMPSTKPTGEGPRG